MQYFIENIDNLFNQCHHEVTYNAIYELMDKYNINNSQFHVTWIKVYDTAKKNGYIQSRTGSSFIKQLYF